MKQRRIGALAAGAVVAAVGAAVLGSGALTPTTPDVRFAQACASAHAFPSEPGGLGGHVVVSEALEPADVRAWHAAPLLDADGQEPQDPRAAEALDVLTEMAADGGQAFLWRVSVDYRGMRGPRLAVCERIGGAALAFEDGSATSMRVINRSDR
ncbi:MAG: hypothetical protein AAFU61_01280 [Pseudomonadota bacterium]